MNYLENEENTAFITDNTMLKSIDHKKLLTSKPGTKALASMIINPLMTNENSPSVNKLIGNAIICTIGLINILIAPSTIATTAVVIHPSIRTPDCNKYAVKPTAAMLRISRISIVIYTDYHRQTSSSIPSKGT